MELQQQKNYFRILYFFSSAEVSDDNNLKIIRYVWNDSMQF